MQSNVAVSSLTSGCLDDIRMGRTQKNPTHLLSFMAEFIPPEAEVCQEQVQELCCYDRMKKLLLRQSQNQRAQQSVHHKADQKSETRTSLFNQRQGLTNFMNRSHKPRIVASKDSESTRLQRSSHRNSLNQNKNMTHFEALSRIPMEIELAKAANIEAAVRNMEKKLTENVQKGTISDKKSLHNSSFVDISCSFPKGSSHTQNPDSSTQQFNTEGRVVGKEAFIRQIKKKSMTIFMEAQSKKRIATMDEFRSVVEKKIEQMIQEILNCSDNDKKEMLCKNMKMKEQLLVQQLTIENLQKENNHFKEKIDLFQADKFKSRNQHNLSKAETLMWEFTNSFPNQTVSEVKARVDAISNRFANLYGRVSKKEDEKFAEIEQNHKRLMTDQQKKIETLEKAYEKLKKESIDNFKLDYSGSELYMKLKHYDQVKAELTQLQNCVFTFYTQWYAARSDSELKLLKSLDSCISERDFEYMLSQKSMFDSINTDDKLKEYISKLVVGIEQIRQLIYPSKSYEKPKPFETIRIIESYVKKSYKHKKENVILEMTKTIHAKAFGDKNNNNKQLSNFITEVGGYPAKQSTGVVGLLKGFQM